MPEGTSVGTIYFDLALKDTINAQLQAAAARTKAQMQHAFDGVWDQIQKSISATGTQAAQAAGAAWSKSVALAQARLNALQRSLNAVNAERKKLVNERADLYRDAYAGREDFFAEALKKELSADRQMQALEAKRSRAMAAIAYARDRLAIEVQAAAERQAAAEQRAYDKAAKAAQTAAAQQLEAARTAHTTNGPPEKLTTVTLGTYQDGSLLDDDIEDAAQDEPDNRFKRIGTGVLNAVGSIADKIKSRIGSLLKGIGTIGKKSLASLHNWIKKTEKEFQKATVGVRRFHARLRGIVSGALVFNGISAGLRQVVSYLGSAALTSRQLKTALGNLQGAAATAAAPLVQVLTPALAALANAAAAVFACLAKIIALFTGKSVSAARTAAKSMAGVGSAASGTSKKVQNAAKSLAGFDEIERLDKKDSSGSGGITPNYSYDGQSPFLDSILAAVKAGDWNQVGQLVAQKLNAAMAAVPWPDIQGKAQRWAANIADTLNGFIARLDWRLTGSTLAQGLNTALLFVDTFVQSFHWNTLGNGIGNALN